MEKILSQEEVERALRDLPGWQREGKAIVRVFDRATFRGAVAFVGTLSDLAERAEHHPDVDIRYSKVKVLLYSHDVGGITERDIRLARQIQAASD